MARKTLHTLILLLYPLIQTRTQLVAELIMFEGADEVSDCAWVCGVSDYPLWHAIMTPSSDKQCG